MNETEIAVKLRALKGAPLSCLIAMILSRRSLGPVNLVSLTGYKKDAVREALQALDSLGLAQIHRRYNGWTTTDEARQMLLPGLLLDGLVDNPADSVDSLGITSLPPERESGFSAIEGDLIALPGESSKLSNSNSEEKLNDLLDSWSAEKPPSSTQIMAALPELLGEPLTGSPSDYHPARLLAWVAQVYDTREKLDHPARLIYWAFHKGRQDADTQYQQTPAFYLPDEFCRGLGLLTRWQLNAREWGAEE